MKKVNHTLTEQLVERLRQEMTKTGLSTSEIIRRALDDYFRKVSTRKERDDGKGKTTEPPQKKASDV